MSHRPLDGRSLCGTARERVLHHFIRDARLAKLVAKLLIFRDRHLLKTNHHRGLGVLELFGESVEVFLFLCLCFHCVRSPPLLRVQRFVQQNSRTHRGGEVYFPNVFTLCGRRLCFHHGVEQCLCVVTQLVGVE